MSLGERRSVGAARTALGLGSAEPLPRTRAEVPPSAPRRGERTTMELPRFVNANPIASALFRALRDLRAEFGRGGLPPKDRRTPEDEARLAVFCVLQELVHILDQFRRAVEQGEHCRLAISEHGRQLGKVVIEITIEGASQ
jgi:hypothetical protein